MNTCKFSIRLVFIAAVLSVFSSLSSAAQLITNEEAKLPAATKFASRGGLTRGPGIKIISPIDSKVKGAFDMKFQFEPHGGATVDPASVKMTYLKSPLVDITDRIKPYISANGIDMAKAEIPPGEHQFKVQVSDNEGRVGSTVVNLVVEK